MSRQATTSLFIDKYHPKADGKCAVSVKVTFNRKKKYYATKYKFSPSEFDKLFGGKVREPYKSFLAALTAQENKARQVIDELGDRFTWALFERRYITKTGDSQNLFALMTERAKELREEERISTAVTYECAIKSLQTFHVKERLTLDEVNVIFLNRYKKWMQNKGNSNTTTGIYLRNVRHILLKAVTDGSIPLELYPFGASTNKFRIPTGKNVKKALQPSQIYAIRSYIPKNGSEEKARDFWVLSFLAGGINVKDIALLKFHSLDKDAIIYERAKTKRANEDKPMIIKIILTDAIKQIIKKWGNKSIDPLEYIFPILSKQDDANDIYKKVQLFTKLINTHMKVIAASIGIETNLTTYVSRHSSSTFLRNAGISIERISEVLGHQDIKTTRSYLASFEDDSKREIADLLSDMSKLKAV